MKDLAIIACVSSDRGLGQDNDLLWHFKDDMKFFRTTTQGATVVMGSRTFASIGSKPLPKRRNIVLSRAEIDRAGVEVVHNETELRKLLAQTDGPKFIVGGASLYQMFIDDAEKLYLTEVAATKPADTYFPEFNRADFVRKVLAAHEQDGIKFEIVEYIRKGSHD